MDRSRATAAVITVVLLSFPLLYVGAYFALVVPSGVPYGEFWCNGDRGIIFSTYRLGDEWPQRIFWPLERVDRRLRPDSWYDTPDKLGINFDE